MSLEEQLADLAGELAGIEERLADLSLDALRSQMRGDGEARELEKRLSRARRSLVKARGLLEGGALG